MEIQVPYGHSFLSATLPDSIPLDMIEPPHVNSVGESLREVESALKNLIGKIRWENFSHARSVAIAINDKTRPVPHEQLLPPLLAHLGNMGIPDKAITLYIAVGTHSPMTPDEFSAILPRRIYGRYQIISHDAEDTASFLYLGETSRGTPVWANKKYTQADLKIVIGNIEPHQFQGFSGGIKSAAIGLTGLETINKNHTLMIHPDAKLGEYEKNPARQDVEEIGELINVHLALNVLLNHERKIVKVLAGDPQAVMQAGIPLSKKICQVALPQKYDMLITSPGGHPKDINIYQAQKALAHAALIANPGATILLAAACTEGSGSPHYDKWMIGKNSYQEVITHFRAEGFHIGPHKAFQIARDAINTHLISYTELDHALASALLLNPVDDFQAAIDMALSSLLPNRRIGILPHASSTIPYIG